MYICYKVQYKSTRILFLFFVLFILAVPPMFVSMYYVGILYLLGLAEWPYVVDDL